MTIGEKIRTQRINLGLTQMELGEELGVRKEQIAKWECGYVESMPISKIKSMANLFEVTPTYLTEADDINGK